MLHVKVNVKLFSISTSKLSPKSVRLGCLKNYGKTIKAALTERMEFNNFERCKRSWKIYSWFFHVDFK